ncbi:MAG: pyrroline-5-carboxylate reductase [Pseudomonadales bacterium]
MKKILFLGAGKMGGAIVQGLMASDTDNTAYFIVDPGMLSGGQSAYSGCTIYADLAECAQHNHRFDVVFLSVKPQIFTAVPFDFDGIVSRETLVISVMAGVSCNTLAAAIPQSTQIVRCMPNVGALKGLSASVNYSSPSLSDQSKQDANYLLSQVGSCGWVDDEYQMHAVTGVSGSGPAYCFAFVEAMAAAGADLGLDRALAEQLAIDTMIGAAELMKSERDPAMLRQMVTSPNGTTQAALQALAKGGALDGLVHTAVSAAAMRSVELSQS